MPGRVTELSETQIIADLLTDRRRLNAAVTSVQMPQPTKDTFTVAATPATTYTLNAIPYQGTGGSSLNLSLNGLELVEGVDYTCDYTTAIVTVSATLTGTPTPADVLTADYWTTGDLIALSGPLSGDSPTYRNRTTAGGPAGTADPTIVLPSDIAAGDLLILAWASFYPPGGDPTGWTRALLTTATGGANPDGVGCWYKTAVSGDAGATVHIPVGTGSDYYTLDVVAYYNCSGVRAVTTSASSVGVTSYATPTSTAVASDTVVSVWLMYAGSSGGLSAFTLDAAVTERVRSDWGGGINQFSHVGIGDETGVAAGTTTARTATWTSSSSWASLTFVLKP